MAKADFERWMSDVFRRTTLDSRLEHPDWGFFAPILPKGLRPDDRRDILQGALADAFSDILRPRVKRTTEVRQRNDRFIETFTYLSRTPEFLKRKDSESTLLTTALRELLQPYVSSKAGKTTKDVALDKAIKYSKGSSSADDMADLSLDPRRFEAPADEDLGTHAPFDLTAQQSDEEAAARRVAGASLTVRKRAEAALTAVCSDFGVTLPKNVNEMAIAALLGDQTITAKITQQAALSVQRGVKPGDLFEILAAAKILLDHMTAKRMRSGDAVIALQELDEKLSLYASKL